MSKTNEQKSADIKDAAMSKCFWHASKFGLAGLAAGGGVTYGLTQTKSLTRYMGTSARAAIPLMVGMFCFSVSYEHAIYDSIRNPEKWGLEYTPTAQERARMQRKAANPKHVELSDFDLQFDPDHRNRQFKPLSWYQRVFNFYIDSPTAFVIGIGAPLGVYIWKNQNPKLTQMQKGLATRVTTQAFVIGLLVSVYGVRDILKRRGKYEGEEIFEEHEREHQRN